MRRYELMLILDPTLEDKNVKSAVERFLATVTDRGGKVVGIDHWGKRRFAYEINHITEGYYAVVEIEAEPATVDELSRVLGLADIVIRHKVTRPQAA